MSATHHTVELVLGLVSGGAFTVGATMHAVQGDIAGVPWDKISGTGAAGLVCVVVWFFLRYATDMRKEHGEELVKRDAVIETVASKFSTTMKESHDTFADTTATLLREARTEASEREKRLQDLLTNLHRDKA